MFADPQPVPAMREATATVLQRLLNAMIQEVVLPAPGGPTT